jgi:hypothetical protein
MTLPLWAASSVSPQEGLSIPAASREPSIMRGLWCATGSIETRSGSVDDLARQDLYPFDQGACELSGGAGIGLRSSYSVIPMDGNEAPDRFHDSKGPRSAGKPIATRQGASERKGEHESSVASFQGVHDHHEGQNDDAVDGDRRHDPTIEGPLRRRPNQAH